MCFIESRTPTICRESMPKLRLTPPVAHRKAISSFPDIVGYLQEVLGQKLVAHIADVAVPRTSGARLPVRHTPSKPRAAPALAYQTFQLLLTE